MLVAKCFSIFRTLFTLFFAALVSTSSFAADLTVEKAHVRAVPEGMINSAAFMVIKNTSSHDRSIVGASSNISKVVELHTHKKEGGMMRMRQIDSIAVKANSETVLKPGGLHIMFIGLKQGLKVGEKVKLELKIDDGSKVNLTVPVQMVAGMRKMPMHQKKQH